MLAGEPALILRFESERMLTFQKHFRTTGTVVNPGADPLLGFGSSSADFKLKTGFDPETDIEGFMSDYRLRNPLSSGADAWVQNLSESWGEGVFRVIVPANFGPGLATENQTQPETQIPQRGFDLRKLSLDQTSTRKLHLFGLSETTRTKMATDSFLKNHSFRIQSAWADPAADYAGVLRDLVSFFEGKNSFPDRAFTNWYRYWKKVGVVSDFSEFVTQNLQAMFPYAEVKGCGAGMNDFFVLYEPQLSSQDFRRCSDRFSEWGVEYWGNLSDFLARG